MIVPYNTFIVLIGALMLGTASGLVGCFFVLRRRSLIGDAVAHATLPGLCLGFMVSYALGLHGGRFLPFLLGGAALTGMLATTCVKYITKKTPLSQESAVAITLSSFYGAGIVLLSVIQNMNNAAQAGLDSFLLGQITGISLHDVALITALAGGIILTITVLFKDLVLISFDSVFAHTTGAQIKKNELILNALMLAVICTALSMVGVVLALALLILPPLSARLLTDNLKTTFMLSGVLGAVSAGCGVHLSATFNDLPTGGIIVLCAGFIFTASILYKGIRHGF